MRWNFRPHHNSLQNVSECLPNTASTKCEYQCKKDRKTQRQMRQVSMFLNACFRQKITKIHIVNTYNIVVYSRQNLRAQKSISKNDRLYFVTQKTCAISFQRNEFAIQVQLAIWYRYDNVCFMDFIEFCFLVVLYQLCFSEKESLSSCCFAICKMETTGIQPGK